MLRKGLGFLKKLLAFLFADPEGWQAAAEHAQDERQFNPHISLPGRLETY